MRGVSWVKENIGLFGLMCASPLIVCILWLSYLAFDQYETFRDERAPFKPFSYRSMEVVPDKACVGQLVSVKLEFHLDPRYEIAEGEAYRYRSYWRNISTGEIINTDAGRYDITRLQEGVITSPILRSVPTEPGLWILFNEVYIEGYVGDTERTQELLMRADMVTQVYPNGDKRCET